MIQGEGMKTNNATASIFHPIPQPGQLLTSQEIAATIKEIPQEIRAIFESAFTLRLPEPTYTEPT